MKKKVVRNISTKRILVLLLSVVFFLPLLDAKATYQGGEVATQKWNISDDGVLHISGDGEMQYIQGEALPPWQTYKHLIKEAIIEDGIETVGDEAFSGCENLAVVRLPASIYQIGTGAFRDCANLTELKLPDRISSILLSAFNGSGLTHITIPAQSGSFSDFPLGGAFIGANNLKQIDVANGNRYYSSIDGVLYSRDYKTLVRYPGGKEGASFTLPNSVEEIGTHAFTLTKLQELIIPLDLKDSVKRSIPSSISVQFAEEDRSTGGFIDVPNSAYYKQAVVWAKENGVTSGTSMTTFSPMGICTRAEVVTFLWRASGKPTPTSSYNPFSDVADETYYHESALWAAENEITKGTTLSTFSPNKICSRAEIITFLWRSKGSPENVGGNTWYSSAVDWAAKHGLFAGSEELFSPEEGCPRSDVVYYIYNAASIPTVKTPSIPSLDGVTLSKQELTSIAWKWKQGEWVTDPKILKAFQQSAERFLEDNIFSKSFMEQMFMEIAVDVITPVVTGQITPVMRAPTGVCFAGYYWSGEPVFAYREYVQYVDGQGVTVVWNVRMDQDSSGNYLYDTFVIRTRDRVFIDYDVPQEFSYFGEKTKFYEWDGIGVHYDSESTSFGRRLIEY